MITKLKIEISLTSDCSLNMKDVSGFITDNSSGFALESTVSLPDDQYKVSNGYFINVVTYNKYKAEPLIVINSSPYNVPTADVLPVYVNNFIPEVYKFKQDAVYTASRLFVMSKTFYDANKLTTRFNGLTVFYYDGTDFYKVVTGIPVKVTLGSMYRDTTLNTNLKVSNTFVSTCYLNLCYFKIMQKIILEECDACAGGKNPDNTFGKCSDGSSIDIKNRDFLYMTLETINYMKELGITGEIQRVIEAVDACGGFCRSVIGSTSSDDCGCG